MLLSKVLICCPGCVSQYRSSGVLITVAKYNAPVISNMKSIGQLRELIQDLCIDNAKYNKYKENARSSFIEITFENAKKIAYSSMAHN